MSDIDDLEIRRFDTERRITLFDNMPSWEIRKWIDGAHKSREYDAYFDAACKVLNSRGNYGKS